MSVAKLPLATRRVNPEEGILAMADPSAAADALLPLYLTIREGRRIIGPDLAERVLTEAPYEGQRKTEEHHVALLADMMRRGKWTKGSQIAFARVGDRLYLVNGKHRMHSVIASGRDIEFQVLIVDVQTMEEVAALYYHFDVAARARSTSDILRAVGGTEMHGLSKAMAKSLYSAAGLISNRLVWPHYLRDPIKARSVDHRLDAMKPWWALAKQFETITEDADRNLRVRLRRPGTVGVGLLTLKYQPDKAVTFWAGVAQNDGLRKGDPRHALVFDILNRVLASGTSMQGVIVPCAAWNAWFEGKSITHIKVTSTATPRLLGTPFDGRRR